MARLASRLAAFPEAVAGPVQFGSRLEALAAYLRIVQHLPVVRLWEWHGVALSTGTVGAFCRRAGARQWTQALTVPVACMDETSLRVAGDTIWLHVIGDGSVTHYRLGDRNNVWTAYAATAVDRLTAYGP